MGGARTHQGTSTVPGLMRTLIGAVLRLRHHNKPVHVLRNSPDVEWWAELDQATGADQSERSGPLWEEAAFLALVSTAPVTM